MHLPTSDSLPFQNDFLPPLKENPPFPMQQLKQEQIFTPQYFTTSFGLNERERLCWIKQLLSETPLTEEQLGELLLMSLKPN